MKDTSTESCLNGAEPGPDEFVPLSVDLFLSGRAVPVDIFIRLNSGKFVRLAANGEDLTRDRINAYRDHDVSSLFIRKKDFSSYVGFGVQLASKLPKVGVIEKDKKLALMSQVARLLAQGIYLKGIDQETFQSARDFVVSTTSILTDQKDAFKLLSMLSSESDFLLSHSLAVSVYSLILARQMSWNSPSMMLKVALGGLLHDVGLKEVDRAIVERLRVDRGAEDTRAYESHAARGAEVLSRIDGIPPEIVQVVLQHHENCLGQGYPAGIKRDRVHPLARLVSVADQFCYFALKNVESEGMEAHLAIEKLMSYHGNVLEPVYLVALMRSFDYPVPEKLRILYEREGTRGVGTGN